MKTNVNMDVELAHTRRPSHAVSTCSPDWPTDSAVERALVDLEWRREAAGKRNGNTHRVNTQVPQESQGCYQYGHVFSRKKMVLIWTMAVTSPHSPWEAGWLGTASKYRGTTRVPFEALREKHVPATSDSRPVVTSWSFYQPTWKNATWVMPRAPKHHSNPEWNSSKMNHWLRSQDVYQSARHVWPCTENKSIEVHNVISTETEWNHRDRAQQFHFPWSKCLFF